MKHEVKSTDQNNNGTGMQGYVRATYAQLVKTFGEPNGQESMDGKVLHSWILSIDGVLCTIYDYKENLDTGKAEDWHIGGKAKAAVQMVNEALAERL